MIESQEHHKDVSKKAFIKGLISGVLIVGVLGGVYFMGASSSGGSPATTSAGSAVSRRSP